jgi:hypothetical protein
MDKNSFWIQMKVEGRERKVVAGLIASHFGTQAEYQKTPSFEYLIKESDDREWRIDKIGTLLIGGAAEDDLVKRFEVLKVLEANGLAAQGKALVTLSTEGHNGVTLRNLINILASKERLILKSMGQAPLIISPAMVKAINFAQIKTIDDFFEATGNEACPGIGITRESITFRCFAATLQLEDLQAYIQFAFAVNKMTLELKRSSPRETETANEKYSFRVFLLRLHFIGEAYRVSRKLFLDRLEGNVAFKTQEQVYKAVIRRNKNKN